MPRRHFITGDFDEPVIVTDGKIVDRPTFSDLYDFARATLPGIKSDAEFAEAIGVKPQVLLNWKKKRSLPNDENMTRFAQVIDINPEYCLSLLGYWRAESNNAPDAAHVFEKMLDRFTPSNDFLNWAKSNGIVATLLLAAVLLFPFPPAKAERPVSAQTVYIMENIDMQ